MRLIGIAGILWVGYASVWANTRVDVYGVSEAEAQLILKKYAKRVSDLERRVLDSALQFSPNNAPLSRLIVQKNRLATQIKQEGSYAFVDIQSVNYPTDKSTYSTIEVVRKDQRQRLRYVTGRTKTYPISKRHDSVDEMHQFELRTEHVMMRPDFVVDKTPCPVYHCIISFNHPELKPYLPRFNRAMLTDKKHIVHTLNLDPNPQRRAAAAFLIGHDPDPRDILKILLPHVTDPDHVVRNNVLRVVAMTLSKSHITDLDATPFLDLLDSPYNSDRNKSLAVLLTLADSQQGKRIILQKGGSRLLDLLALRQPNNHGLAYLILKKISHKAFSDQDLKAWSVWLAQSHSQ